MRLKQLHALGVRTWNDVVQNPKGVPSTLRPALVDECDRCLQALSVGDIHYLVERLAPTDKWRILAHLLEQTSYFDIETQGLECDAPITVIACWHKGQLHNFVEHENLDEFLTLLDDVTLLASFNGSSFDVPRVLDNFHIPRLPCPHLDLRWLCYHQGLRGSLKRITARLGIDRPSDLEATDGALAIHLWHAWVAKQDLAAREHLLRYCAADVLLLVMLAQKLVDRSIISHDDLWAQLPAPPTAEKTSLQTTHRGTTAATHRPAPKALSKLRARRIRLAG